MPASSLSTVRKNERGTLDRKEQHGVSSTKRENNINCLPEINSSSFQTAVASSFWLIENFQGGESRCKVKFRVIKCEGVHLLEMYDHQAIPSSEPSPGQRKGLGRKLCAFKHIQSLFYSSGPLKQMTSHFELIKQPLFIPLPIDRGIQKG